jgi:hypothetical protein
MDRYVEWTIKKWIIFMPPFEEGRAYCFAAVGLSVSVHPVSIHFLPSSCTYCLHIGCTYWNEIWYTDLSDEYLGHDLFYVWSSHFCQTYGPWT